MCVCKHTLIFTLLPYLPTSCFLLSFFRTHMRTHTCGHRHFYVHCSALRLCCAHASWLRSSCVCVVRVCVLCMWPLNCFLYASLFFSASLFHSALSSVLLNSSSLLSLCFFSPFPPPRPLSAAPLSSCPPVLRSSSPPVVSTHTRVLLSSVRWS